jgi:hypothetical protein
MIKPLIVRTYNQRQFYVYNAYIEIDIQESILHHWLKIKVMGGENHLKITGQLKYFASENPLNYVLTAITI